MHGNVRPLFLFVDAKAIARSGAQCCGYGHNHHGCDSDFPKVPTFFQAGQSQRPDDMKPHGKNKKNGNEFCHFILSFPASGHSPPQSGHDCFAKAECL
jgi:hypothetical protein